MLDLAHYPEIDEGDKPLLTPRNVDYLLMRLLPKNIAGLLAEAYETATPREYRDYLAGSIAGQTATLRKLVAICCSHDYAQRLFGAIDHVEPPEED